MSRRNYEKGPDRPGGSRGGGYSTETRHYIQTAEPVFETTAQRERRPGRRRRGCAQARLTFLERRQAKVAETLLTDLLPCLKKKP